jgi:hypothetical protein
MPIQMKHGANPGVVLGASFAAGQAQQRQEAEMAHLQATEKRDAQTRDQEFQRQQMADQFGLREGEFEFRLTAKQKADQEKYANAYAEIEGNEGFTEAEKTEAKRRLTAKMAGIKPLPMRKDLSPWPKGQGIGESWVNPNTGAIETRRPDTSIDIKSNPMIPTVQDMYKAYGEFAGSMTKPNPDPDGEPIAASPDEVWGAVRRAMTERQAIISQMPGQQGQPGAAGSGEEDFSRGDWLVKAFQGGGQGEVVGDPAFKERFASAIRSGGTGDISKATGLMGEASRMAMSAIEGTPATKADRAASPEWLETAQQIETAYEAKDMKSLRRAMFAAKRSGNRDLLDELRKRLDGGTTKKTGKKRKAKHSDFRKRMSARITGDA